MFRELKESQMSAGLSNTSKIVASIIVTGAIIVVSIFWTQGELDFLPRALEPEYLRVMRASAIDPDSVEFRNVTGPQNNLVCGEWRAKNRFGAYVEWRVFALRERTHGTGWSETFTRCLLDCTSRQHGLPYGLCF